MLLLVHVILYAVAVTVEPAVACVVAVVVLPAALIEVYEVVATTALLENDVEIIVAYPLMVALLKMLFQVQMVLLELFRYCCSCCSCCCSCCWCSSCSCCWFFVAVKIATGVIAKHLRLLLFRWSLEK